MTENISNSPETAPVSDPRKERLAAALRANLRRRKVQGRAQADQEAAVDNGCRPQSPE